MSSRDRESKWPTRIMRVVLTMFFWALGSLPLVGWSALKTHYDHGTATPEILGVVLKGVGILALAVWFVVAGLGTYWIWFDSRHIRKGKV
jgi:hypothetical protein